MRHAASAIASCLTLNPLRRVQSTQQLIEDAGCQDKAFEHKLGDGCDEEIDGDRAGSQPPDGHNHIAKLEDSLHLSILSYLSGFNSTIVDDAHLASQWWISAPRRGLSLHAISHSNVDRCVS